MRRIWIPLTLGALGAATFTAVSADAGQQPAARYRVVATFEVGRVPSWFPVGFGLLTHGERQFAAYYDADHRMVVAERRLGEPAWRQVVLPSRVGWDSHNYITMAIDRTGHLHLSGNMHCVPLVYFRTQDGADITTFERLPMTGNEEERCTYPRFLRTPDGTLLFMYRSGGSGNGRRYVNRYDPATGTWSRFVDEPFFEGAGKRNAYPLGPSRGPDGYFHLVWVWRDTPDCATNHHLSHARSRDLEHWQTAGGTELELPLTLEQTAVCVDPIPSGGGIINGCERLMFDADDRPLIAYHKRDGEGHMQIWVASFRDGAWSTRAVTEWDEPIPFSGGGAMPFIGIRLGAFERIEPGLLSIGYRHRTRGSGRILIDETTLTPVERNVTVRREFPRDLMRPTIDFDGIGVRLARDLGAASSDGTVYVLRWEALGAHHDRPREPPLPPPSPLRLVRLVPVDG